MANWQIALVKEQGVNFAVATVKDHVLGNNNQSDQLVSSLSVQLGQPTVLLGANQHRLYGRKDLVRFLQNVHPSRLPWRRMTL
jgi:hypothetical protein